MMKRMRMRERMMKRKRMRMTGKDERCYMREAIGERMEIRMKEMMRVKMRGKDEVEEEDKGKDE